MQDDQLKVMKVETEECSKGVSGSSQIKLNQMENSNSVTPAKTEGNQLNQCLTREKITSEQSLDMLTSSNNDSPHSCINDKDLDSLLSVETVEKSPNLKHSEAADDIGEDGQYYNAAIIYSFLMYFLEKVIHVFRQEQFGKGYIVAVITSTKTAKTSELTSPLAKGFRFNTFSKIGYGAIVDWIVNLCLAKMVNF